SHARKLDASTKQVAEWAESYWPNCIESSTSFFPILKAAGYGGNIDQLWLSLYGRWKPSIPEAHGTIMRVSSVFGGQTYRIPGTRTVASGQSRKPGSHRS